MKKQTIAFLFVLAVLLTVVPSAAHAGILDPLPINYWKLNGAGNITQKTASTTVYVTGGNTGIAMGQDPNVPTFNGISLNGNLNENSNIGFYGGGSNNNLYLQGLGAIALRPNGATQRVTFNSNGFMGIGSSSPTYPISVTASTGDIYSTGPHRGSDFLLGVATETPQIVWEGDSLTQGHGYAPYSTYLTLPTFNGATFNQTNIGVSGRMLSTMIQQAPYNLNNLYSQTGGINIVVVLGGGNDMYATNDNLTPQQTLNRLIELCQHERLLGYKVVVMTMISNVLLDSKVVTYNQLIRQQWPEFADAMVDLGADSRIGPLGAYSNLTYFDADQTHLNDTGNAVVASILQPVLNRLVLNQDSVGVNLSVTGSMSVGTTTMVATTTTLFSVATSTTPSLKVTKNGLVGISTSTPAFPLDVFGNASIEGQQLLLNPYNQVTGVQILMNGGRGTIGMDSAIANLILQGGNSKGIKFNVNNGTFGLGTAGVFTTAGNFGLGTTTPTAQFVQVAASSTQATTAYNGLVSIIAGLENTTLMFFQEIDQWGHLIVSGDAPVLSSCGTSPSFVGAGNDRAMAVQVGSVSATACTITFAHAYVAAPTCTVTNRSMSVVNAMTYTISTSAVTVSQTGLTGDILDIQCTGTQ